MPAVLTVPDFHRAWLIIVFILAALIASACSQQEEPSPPPSTALKPDANTRFYVNDQLGSAALVTNLDGDILARDAPAPYGEPWVTWREGHAAGPAYRFADQEDDPVSTSVAIGARHYVPQLGRWASPDPLFIQKPETLLGRPGERNLYRYAAHNPIHNTDPTGTSWWTKALKVGRAVVRGGSAVESFRGNIEDAKTLVDPNASTASRVVAGLSLASEIAPVSVDDIRSLAKLAGGTSSALKAVKQAAGSAQKASGGAAKHSRVGRWMSNDEYKKMQRSGIVQESHSGTTHVARPATPSAYDKQARPGSLYVEFDVPDQSLKQTSEQWAKVLGPNTIEGRLAAKRGQPVPQMPAASNVEHVASKMRYRSGKGGS